MEVYSNIILTIICLSIWFLIMFLTRTIQSMNNLSDKLDDFISISDETNYNFCILQIDKMEKGIKELTDKLEKL